MIGGGPEAELSFVSLTAYWVSSLVLSSLAEHDIDVLCRAQHSAIRGDCSDVSGDSMVGAEG